MSSLRNAVQRRNHKERAQPHSRQKWGILEKHKDYALRAQDHNVKKRKIKDLREKAATRNEDEFYFGMLSTQSSRGQKVGDRGNRSLAQKEVTVLKRQDAAYLRTMLQVVKREISKVEQEIQLLESGENGVEIVTLNDNAHSKGLHAVFVDDSDEQKSFSAHEWFNTNEDGLGRGFNRPRNEKSSPEEDNDDTGPSQRFSRKQQIAAEDATKQARREQKKRVHAQEVRMQKLELLRKQENDLVEAEHDLEQQRAKLSNTASSGVSKKGVPFKIRERKR